MMHITFYPFTTYFAHGGVVGILLSLLTFFLIIALIAYALEVIFAPDEPKVPSQDYSIAILKERYAKGQITREEYQRKLQELQVV